MVEFKNKLKEVDKKEKINKIINIKNIYAQYNPNRFNQWKSIFKKNIKDEYLLDMLYSPHYELLNIYNSNELKQIEKTKYFQLQKKYGRNYKWIKNKIDKFIDVFNNIKDNGYDLNQKIIVLNKSLIENKYNKSGYELFEGHHRLSCLLYLNYNFIECDFVEN